MKLVQPGMRHYKEMMRADEQYDEAGEETYCGVSSRPGYAAWLFMINRQAQPDVAAHGINPNEIWLLVDDDEHILALGQLRVVETWDVMTWAGHIGYSVPPDLRGKGYATEILRQLLDKAFERGLNKVLLTCDRDNGASRRVIEKCGGVFSGFYTDSQFDKRLYWFTKEAWYAK